MAAPAANERHAEHALNTPGAAADIAPSTAGTPEPAAPFPGPRWRAGPRAPALVALAALLLVAGLAAAALLAAPRPPGERSAEAGFARDTAAHHEQAVAMAVAMRDRAVDPLGRGPALDVALTQQAQGGRMRGWLDAWGLPPTGAAPPMAWMGHPVAGRLPGLATRQELDDLAALPPAEAETRFLRLMVRHHRAALPMAGAALPMAGAALARSGRPEARALAEAVLASQQGEIAYMDDLRRRRGAAP